MTRDRQTIRAQSNPEVGTSDVISETTNAEPKQFDFLEGEWNAICRFPLPDGSWGEGQGSLTASKVLGGCVSLEFFEGPYQGTTIKGLGLRAFNPQTSQWEHTWTDTSGPGGFLVWRGRFEGGAVDLHGQWDDESGHHVLSRLTWSRITEQSAHWESHRSIDGGKTWTKHWVIDFTRETTSKPAEFTECTARSVLTGRARGRGEAPA
jgi:hypothetical protein